MDRALQANKREKGGERERERERERDKAADWEAYASSWIIISNYIET